MDSSTKEKLLDSSATYCTLLNAVVTAAIVVVLYAFWKEARSETIRKQVNLPGPKPWPFFGNLLDVRKFNGIHLMLHDYLQTYGKVFSLTVGRKPAIVIGDPDFLKQILVKDFWNFRNRFMQLKPNGPAAKGIFIARDEEWKRIRATLSPSFSAKKMKGMVSLMDESIERVMEKINALADTGETGDASVRTSISEFVLKKLKCVYQNQEINGSEVPCELTTGLTQHHVTKLRHWREFYVLILIKSYP